MTKEESKKSLSTALRDTNLGAAIVSFGESVVRVHAGLRRNYHKPAQTFSKGFLYMLGMHMVLAVLYFPLLLLPSYWPIGVEVCTTAVVWTEIYLCISVIVWCAFMIAPTPWDIYLFGLPFLVLNLFSLVLVLLPKKVAAGAEVPFVGGGRIGTGLCLFASSLVVFLIGWVSAWAAYSVQG